MTAKVGSLYEADKIEQAKAILQPYILRRLKTNVTIHFLIFLFQLNLVYCFLRLHEGIVSLGSDKFCEFVSVHKIQQVFAFLNAVCFRNHNLFAFVF